MSQYYEMNVSISGYDKTKEENIINHLGQEWNFDNDFFYCAGNDEESYYIEWMGRDSLCGGEEKFVDRISKVIWKANDGFCQIKVIATYLENPPCNEYIQDKDSYKEFIRLEKL